MNNDKAPPRPPLTTERTVNSFAPDQQDESHPWSGDEHLGHRDVPYKEFVATLGFPCTIGTAIAASAAFGIIAASSLFGDTSPEAIEKLRNVAALLSWSAGCYANATAIVVCLQLLYSSPPFCNVMTKKISYTWELPKNDEPWDFLRCLIAYGTVGWGFLALVLLGGGTILLIQALSPPFGGPLLLTDIPIALGFGATLCTFVAVALLERHSARRK